MSESIRLEIITPERQIFSEDVQITIAPGTEGEFGVLHGHVPFLTQLNVGCIQYRTLGGDLKCLFISGGIAQVLPDAVNILTPAAERAEDINLERARRAKERALERLEKKEEDPSVDVTRAQAALVRAIARIHLATQI